MLEKEGKEGEIIREVKCKAVPRIARELLTEKHFLPPNEEEEEEEEEEAAAAPSSRDVITTWRIGGIVGEGDIGMSLAGRKLPSMINFKRTVEAGFSLSRV